MLQQFRHLYPQGSFISELINIDRGLYIVKVSVQNQGTILGTGLAAAETVEKAEDQARERALMIVNLTNLDSIPPQSQATSSQSLVVPLVAPREEKQIIPIPEKPQPDIKETVTTESFSPPEIEDFVAWETEEVIPPTNPVVENQINLFDQPITSESLEEKVSVATESTIELDFNEIRHKIDLEMKRLNWTKEQGRDYLLSTYGKRSRLHLTDEELLEFWHYLENLPS